MRKNVHWLVLFGTLSITIIISFLIYDIIIENTMHDFDDQVSEITDAIPLRIKAYEQVLSGGQGLFAASTLVTREEWHIFVNMQSTEERFPGIQGIGFSKLIGNKENLASHIEQIRKEGFSNYTVKPEDDREEYHSIIYLEPFDERNRRAFGYDMYSEPIRHEAMNLARDTGLPALTGKVKLVQETETDIQTGFLLYTPVYSIEKPILTIEQRQSALEGFVYAPFRMNNFMKGIVSPTDTDITFVIYDTNSDPENIMYDFSKVNNIAENEIDYYLSKTVVMDIDQRQWVVKVTALNSIHTEFENIFLISVLITGFSLSILLWIMLRNNTKMLILLEQSIKQEKMSMVGELSARLAHDIRNPLSIIQVSLENLKLKYGAHESAEKSFDKVGRSISRITHQIDDVLDFVRGHTPELHNVKFSEIITDVLDSTIIPNNVELILPKNNVKFFADKRLFTVAIDNLVLNAVQSIGEKGTIEITVEENNDSVIIQIKDSGEGIQKENLDLIFNPLFTTKQQGTGLGLVGVKSIVESHGGIISVTSPPTIFTITLPKVSDKV